MKPGTIVIVTDEDTGLPLDCYVEQDDQPHHKIDLHAVEATRRIMVNAPSTTTITFDFGVRWETRKSATT